MSWIKKKSKLPHNKRDSLLKKLASINGIHDTKSFFNPPVSALNDPYLLTNIEDACLEILNAIQSGKNISIYADVDADGEASTAIMYRYISYFTDKVTYFYNQRSEGHGIRNGKKNIPEGTEVLIIVDSSTNDYETCKELLDCGIEKIIILDHHPVTKKNDFAIVVNPQLEEDPYPNKDISGSGVCWKVCQVLDDMTGNDFSEDLIDLAGLGIVSDVMSMRDMENRYIVSQALDNMNNIGLLAIISKNDYLDLFNLTTKDIGFSITPLLNAVARLEQIELALELLITDDEDRANEIVDTMMQINESRKQMQAAYIKKFEPLINPDDNIIVIVDDTIGKGFSGLVAGDLASKNQKPVAILRKTKGSKMLSGSFRSYGDFKLKTFFENMDFKFSVMEGHEGAGGIGLKEEKLQEFISLTNEKLESENFEQNHYYDIVIDSNEITEDMLYEIADFNRLSGRGITEAKFLVTNLLPEEKKTMGKDKSSLKVICSNGLNLMKFRTDKKFISSFPIMIPCEAVGGLSLNIWRDWKKKESKTIQLILDDYKTV